MADLIPDYRRILTALIGELAAHSAISLEDYYIGDGLPLDEIAALTQDYNVELDASLVAFYTQVDGCWIDWKLDPEQTDVAIEYAMAYPEPIDGKVNIMSLDEMLMPWELPDDSALVDQASDEYEKDKVQRFRIFDDNVEEAYVGFLEEEGRIEDVLYFLKQEQDMYTVGATVEQYLLGLRQSRGFYWWQKLFALRPAGADHEAMYVYIPQLFRGETFEAFRG